MNLFRRHRDPDLPEDPVVNRARVAELIDRDPARVTGYFRAGKMPEPEGWLDVEKKKSPVWRESVIRSWWLDRGGEVTNVRGRYHRTWPQDPSLEPERLEEGILEIPHPKPWVDKALTLHYRVYRAMDGGGPVVLLGTPGQRWFSWPNHGWPWQNVRGDLHRNLITDIDFAQPVFLLLQAHDPDWAAGGMPRELYIRDPEDHEAIVNPLDVKRLVGMPFDVYPVELYSTSNINARRTSGAADTPTADLVVRDEKSIAQLVRDLHVLDEHRTALLGGGDKEQAETVEFAAAVVAHQTLEHNEEAESRNRYRSEWPGRLHEPGHADHVHVAITAVARTLAAKERALANKYHFPDATPLIEDLRSSDEPWKHQRMYHYQIHPDARTRLEEIRDLLHEVTLLEGRLRDALTRAEDRLRKLAHSADPVWARLDRDPKTINFSGGSDLMRTYLDQLQVVTAIASLPRHLQRRALQLQEHERSADWINRRLLHDTAIDALVLAGDDPSRDDEASAREKVDRYHDPDPDLGQPRLSAQQREALIRDYLTDKPQARIEWPTAIPTHTLDELATARLVAPGANWGVERPVFIQWPNGTLEPLTLNNNTHFSGFAWGVSLTDSLTDAIIDLLLGETASTPADHHTQEQDEWRRRARAVIRSQIDLTSGPLDLDLAPLAEYPRQDPYPEDTRPA